MSRFSVFATGDFKQVVAKLGFHGTLYFIDRSAEYHFVKGLDHLTRAEAAQLSALLAGRALRVCLGESGKIGAIGDLIFQGLTFSFRTDKDVTSACTCNGFSP